VLSLCRQDEFARGSWSRQPELAGKPIPQPGGAVSILWLQGGVAAGFLVADSQQPQDVSNICGDDLVVFTIGIQKNNRRPRDFATRVKPEGVERTVRSTAENGKLRRGPFIITKPGESGTASIHLEFKAPADGAVVCLGELAQATQLGGELDSIGESCLDVIGEPSEPSVMWNDIETAPRF
jgi:hypothetical protein